jgi:uncharacterized protein (TIGR03790 family)
MILFEKDKAMRIFVFVLLAIGLSQATPSRGAVSSGGEVVVVYNKNVPASKEVADYYVQKRGVPGDQVFGFALSSGEDMSRAEFRDELQKPLAKLLSSKKLWRIGSETIPATSNELSRLQWRVKESKIRYAVLCYGVPLRIKPDPTMKEPGMEQLRPEFRRDEACVDSELAVLPMIEDRPLIFSPLPNRLYTCTNSAWLHPTNGLLLVSRLDGPTPEIAKGLVDKALAAEADGLWGRAYFDVRNTTEPGMKTGDDWIRGGADLCKRLGFETYVDENPGTIPDGFPMSQIAYYLGWYTADAAGPFAQPKVEFMPGAFAYHLHSHSAHTIRTNLAWVGPFLIKGVTATMGTVHEPYLGGTPDVAVFTSRFIYLGMTFGEAAWAAQPVVSWQTTVVGDPLYRPFGGSPEAIHDRFTRERNPLLAWSYLRLVNLNLAVGKKMDEMAMFIDALGGRTNSAILVEKLGDLYSGLGKPSSSAHAYESALKLETTPQQRIRLRLNLAEKLLALGEKEKAKANYEKLIKEAPNYPDKAAIQTRIAQLSPAPPAQPKAEK